MFSYKLPVAIVTAIAFLQPPVVIAQDIAEVNNIARNISVKITGHSNGSGFIFDKQKNTYFVLTNQHVVSEDSEYEIQTYEGIKHQVTDKQEIPDLDIAIIQFESTEEYKVAELGNSDELEPRQSISVAGFPGKQTDIDIIDGQIRSIRQEIIANPASEKGYALVYTNQTFGGHSGGAVLNNQGHVVAINGKTDFDITTGRDVSRGIPINLLSIALGKPIPIIEAESEISPISLPPNTNDDFGTSTEYKLAYPIVNAVKYASVLDKAGLRTSSINSLAASQNKIISGGDDRQIRIWNLETGELEQTLQGHSAQVFSVAANKNKIVSGSADNTIKIWDLDTGELEQTLQSHSAEVYSVAIEANKIVSGSADNTIKIWNLDTGELERTLSGHSSIVASVDIDRNKIVSGSWDQTIKIWNLDTGELEQTLAGHIDVVRSIAISGDIIVSGSYDETIKVWSSVTGELKQTFPNGIGEPIFSPYSVAINENKIVGGGSGGTITIHNLASGKLEQTISAHSDRIGSLTIFEDKIISGGIDETIKVWQLQN